MFNPINLDEAAKSYQSAKPFRHIVIHSAIDENIVNAVHDEFPRVRDHNCVAYANPLEIKDITSGRDMFGSTTNVLVDYLNGQTFLDILQKITGMERPIVADHKLMGGGLHESYTGGLLKLHIDFNKHYETGYDRRINLLLYLNKDWKEEYGGHIELWPRDLTEGEDVVKVLPTFNTMVIFNTDEHSFHGFPDAIKCPEGERRKSLAMYYFTDGRPQEELNPEVHFSVWGTRLHKDGTKYEADIDVEKLSVSEH